jgi:hypothetical protein
MFPIASNNSQAPLFLKFSAVTFRGRGSLTINVETVNLKPLGNRRLHLNVQSINQSVGVSGAKNSTPLKVIGKGGMKKGAQEVYAPQRGFGLNDHRNP